jgi:hypothetical protein
MVERARDAGVVARALERVTVHRPQRWCDCRRRTDGLGVGISTSRALIGYGALIRRLELGGDSTVRQKKRVVRQSFVDGKPGSDQMLLL